jgi:hypothetical protein
MGAAIGGSDVGAGRARKGRLRAAFAVFPFCVFPSCVFERLQLLQINHTKRPSQIIVRTGGEEELVGPAIA